MVAEAGCGVDWASIWKHLRADPNHALAWDQLEIRVRALALPRVGHLGDEALADAVADTCASVVLDLASARGPDTFRGFVLGKYLNVQKGVVRLAERRRISLDEVVEQAAPPIVDHDDPRYLALDRCLERLPSRDRRAVELRFFAEAEARQIASELQVTEGNARRIVFNGVNRLRKCAQAAVGNVAAGSVG